MAATPTSRRLPVGSLGVDATFKSPLSMEGRFGQEGQAMSPGGRQRFAAPIVLLLFAQVLFLATPARALPGSWGPSTLLDALPGPSGDPQVAINPSGIAITVWTQESENGVYWNIFARRYVPGQG